MDINSLLLLHEVVNAQSITKASARLRIPKSTISRRLTLLEQQVGAILLIRGSRKLSLTEIGGKLYEHCRRIALEVEEAGLELTEMGSSVRGNLRVIVPADFGIFWFGKAIAEFMLKYPELSAEIVVSNQSLDQAVEPYDIALHIGAIKPSSLVYRRLATVTRGVYASPDYLKRCGVPSSIEDFRRFDCIITEFQRQEGVLSLRNRSRRRVIEVTGKVTVNNVGIARELIIGGVGLGILPNILCRSDVKAKRLIRVMSDWETPPMIAIALIHKRSYLPHKTRVFLDFMASRLAAEEDQAETTVTPSPRYRTEHTRKATS